MKSDVILVGAGNLATSLALAFKAAGNPPIAVWSRTIESARILGDLVGCLYTNVLEELPQADVVIISVADAALPQIARKVAVRFPGALILHTAGSVPMELLYDAGCSRFGVLYPMQTFSKVRPVDFSTVTTFVEGCDGETLSCIHSLAAMLGGRVFEADSRQRQCLHVAAVYACNFSNAMYAMSAQLLGKYNMPFEAMLPLIDETAAKVHTLHPLEAQTGPAVRGDSAVMEAHRTMLDDDLLEIYNKISEYIAKNRK